MTDAMAAATALEAAIAAAADLACDDGQIAVDAVLVVGIQQIDDDGDRIGGVMIYPRHGCQPTYLTLGLLDAARRLVNQQV